MTPTIEDLLAKACDRLREELRKAREENERARALIKNAAGIHVGEHDGEDPYCIPCPTCRQAMLDFLAALANRKGTND